MKWWRELADRVGWVTKHSGTHLHVSDLQHGKGKAVQVRSQIYHQLCKRSKCVEIWHHAKTKVISGKFVSFLHFVHCIISADGKTGRKASKSKVTKKMQPFSHRPSASIRFTIWQTPETITSSTISEPIGCDDTVASGVSAQYFWCSGAAMDIC